MPAPRILIVDDSALFRKSMKKILAPLDSEISLACDGQEGLEMAMQQDFDVVISDIEMPKVNGIKLCRQLKNTPATQGIPIIMVSLFDSDQDIDKGFKAGASAYLPKDDIKDHLLGTVQSILSQTRLNHDRLIQVVDDSATIRHIVKSGLAKAGFEVITSENGKKALAQLNTYRPDLIISDIEMPEMDGFDFCAAVQNSPDLVELPFVVMSSKTDRSYMQRMIQNGASAYICKPFNIDELVILVEKILSDQFLLLLKEKERLESERLLMVASISSLITALEARDQYTKGHSEAVGKIVSGMISLTGASRRDVEMVTIGARLHDIGKIGIRDEILLKPASLTEEEFSHIKQHPLIGTAILESIPSFSEVLPMVLSHHERIDGKGYPHGLKGGKIPLWPRMTAVADTYHALTSDRPYRRGMSHGRALQIIEDVRNTQLCPDCVDLFFEWNAVHNTVSDSTSRFFAEQQRAIA